MSEPSEGDREPRGYTRPDLPMHGVNDSSNSSRLRRLRPESSCLHSPSPFPLGSSPAIAHDRKWSATVIIIVHTLPTPSDAWLLPSTSSSHKNALPTGYRAFAPCARGIRHDPASQDLTTSTLPTANLNDSSGGLHSPPSRTCDIFRSEKINPLGIMPLVPMALIHTLSGLHHVYWHLRSVSRDTWTCHGISLSPPTH